MKYIVTSVADFYEVFNTNTKMTVYVTRNIAKCKTVAHQLNTGVVFEGDLK